MVIFVFKCFFEMGGIRKIGVFTSGGDSPGMNACIRSVIRTCIYNKVEVTGIIKGYQGMIDADFMPMSARSVSNIIQRGGTMLKSSRSSEFLSAEGREKAINNLKKEGIDALIAIGGDGTFRGAIEFTCEFGIPVIGIPGTIDNDLFGTDFTLGFDTAVNTAVEAIDKIRDTAASHDRLFFIEVMGRDAGYIALWSGISGGAEAILMPEEKTNIEELIKLLEKGKQGQKTSNIVIVCEGDDAGGAAEIAKSVKKLRPDFDTRVTVLGHIQRGGSPSAFDRILGTRLGVAAVEALLNGEQGKMVGILKNEINFTDFSKATKQQKPIDAEFVKISKITSI
jgi:6-phosphofructokinase 1